MMPRENMMNMARIHAPLVASLPEPPAAFTVAEVEGDQYMMLRLMRAGVLQRESHNTGSVGHVWSVDPQAYELACQHRDQTPRFACCGSTGITNDNGTLRCIDCGAEKTRAEAKEILS